MSISGQDIAESTLRDLSPDQTVQRSASGSSNALLTQLSPQALRLIEPLAERSFTEGTVLWEIGEPVREVIFPLSGLISILVPTGDGHEVEVSAIGQKGAAGIPYASENPLAQSRAIAQIGGRYISISAGRFASAMQQDGEIRSLAGDCHAWLLMQAQYLAACNAVHAADARFCRWLLRAADATGTDAIPVTQESVAQLLGIRRTTITLIAQHLQISGLISYRRGKIAIRDRAGLQAAACACYATLSRECGHSRPAAAPIASPPTAYSAAD